MWWRVLIFLTFNFGLSTALLAQGGFTTVTGTITDPNGLKYSCGTITAQLITAGGAAPTLNGGGFTTQTSPIGLGCPTTPDTGAPGSFLMRLADSGVIVPSTTTWRFTINLAPGIPPPAGTGPQSFSVTTAINCSTNTPATCTSNAMDISTLLSGSAPAISNGGAGTLTGTTNPIGACTNGQLYINTTTSGLWLCSNSVWVADNFTGPNIVDVTRYGVTAAGNEVCDASTTSSTTQTTSANDPAFTSSMVGWSAQASNTCVDSPSYTAVLNRGIINTVNNAHSITTSTTALSTVTVAAHLVWGPLEDTQLTAAENAAWNVNFSGQGICPSLTTPSGFIYVRLAHYNTMQCNDQYTGPLSTGATIYGQGPMASRLMLASDFDFTTCPIYNSFHVCFAGKNGVKKYNWGISGGNHPGANPAAATALIDEGTDSFSQNINLVGFGSGLSNLTAFAMEGVGTTDSTVIEDGMGGNGGTFDPANISAGGSCINCTFLNNTFQAMFQNGGAFSYYDNAFGATGAGSTADIFKLQAGIAHIIHSSFQYGSQAQNLVESDAGAFADLNGISEFGSRQTGSNGPYAHGGTVVMTNSSIFYGSAGVGVTVDTNGVYKDGCGNTFNGTGAAINIITSGVVYPCEDGSTTYTTQPTAGKLDCASSASPAVCGAYYGGSVSIAVAATTIVVNTTAIGANSIVEITEDSSLGTKLGITCNTTTGRTYEVSARTAGTSFTITTSAAPVTNPACLSYRIFQ